VDARDPPEPHAARASGKAAHRTDSKTQTIELISRTVSQRTLIDREPKGDLSKGDAHVVKSNLRNAVPQFGRGKRALVGTDVATFTVVSLFPSRVRIRLTVNLPRGTLRGDGPVNDISQTIRVVGGTGVFAGARGTAEVRQLAADGDPALNIYRLRLP
jgi:hypothetical protein